MARGDGLLVYRNGTREKIDMEISDGGRKNNKFYFSYRPYAGGGRRTLNSQTMAIGIISTIK
jgi:hypothetical protein